LESGETVGDGLERLADRIEMVQPFLETEVGEVVGAEFVAEESRELFILENLQGSARKNLKILLAANKRLNTAYVLKESFGQLWDYNREAWARKFFENWRDQLKWQRLEALRELR
jgi:Transposase